METIETVKRKSNAGRPRQHKKICAHSLDMEIADFLDSIEGGERSRTINMYLAQWPEFQASEQGKAWKQRKGK